MKQTPDEDARKEESGEIYPTANAFSIIYGNTEPQIMLQNTGRMILNQIALEKLNNPKAVLFCIHLESGNLTLSIRATNYEEDPLGCLVTPISPRSGQQTRPDQQMYGINAIEVLKLINYPIGKITNFAPECETGRLVIDISSVLDNA